MIVVADANRFGSGVRVSEGSFFDRRIPVRWASKGNLPGSMLAIPILPALAAVLRAL